jgi:hypothetical protein
MSPDQTPREILLAEREYLLTEVRRLTADSEPAATTNGLNEVIEELRAIRRRVIEIERMISLSE